MFLSVVLVCFVVALDGTCHVIAKLLLQKINQEWCKHIWHTHATTYKHFHSFILTDAYTPALQTERSFRTRWGSCTPVTYCTLTIYQQFLILRSRLSPFFCQSLPDYFVSFMGDIITARYVIFAFGFLLAIVAAFFYSHMLRYQIIGQVWCNSQCCSIWITSRYCHAYKRHDDGNLTATSTSCVIYSINLVWTEKISPLQFNKPSVKINLGPLYLLLQCLCWTSLVMIFLMMCVLVALCTYTSNKWRREDPQVHSKTARYALIVSHIWNCFSPQKLCDLQSQPQSCSKISRSTL